MEIPVKGNIKFNVLVALSKGHPTKADNTKKWPVFSMQAVTQRLNETSCLISSKTKERHSCDLLNEKRVNLGAALDSMQRGGGSSSERYGCGLWPSHWRRRWWDGIMQSALVSWPPVNDRQLDQTQRTVPQGNG